VAALGDLLLNPIARLYETEFECFLSTM